MVHTSHRCYSLNKLIHMTCAEWSPAHSMSSLKSIRPQYSLLKFYSFHLLRHKILLDRPSSPQCKVLSHAKLQIPIVELMF